MTGDGGVLDGFRIGQVPAGVGAEVSDFASEWEDVRFATRVWERQVAEGYRVHLRIHVLRGDRLTDLAALRDFLAGYLERDPASWDDFSHGTSPGGSSDDQVFWLVEPGVGLAVLVDPERVGPDELLATALSVQPI
ncbi:hypothetical protein [Micromonospora sp. NPDC126480]|uniref:hypothetical protein n=1 Tax=Micromonospora sp. NPDC126480 TaxID=3155312 RepID=UPI00331C1209